MAILSAATTIVQATKTVPTNLGIHVRYLQHIHNVGTGSKDGSDRLEIHMAILNADATLTQAAGSFPSD